MLFELERGQVRDEPPFATFISDLVDRWKLTARVSVEGDFDAVPEAILETAHAIVSEALANAAKHSGVPDVAVRVSRTPRRSASRSRTAAAASWP